MRLFLVTSLVLASGSAAFLACSSNTPSANNGGGNQDASLGDSGLAPEAGPSSDDAEAEAGFGYTTPPAWDQPVTRPTDSAATASRASCSFARGDMPAKTLGTSTPIDTEIPIQNIVVVMMENRSFDSMLGHLN